VISSTWIDTARARLIDLRGRGEGWSYRRATAPSAEPTTLACLGLLCSGGDQQAKHGGDECRRSADWLASLQSLDGSLGVSASLPTPGWATPYGILLWAAMGGYSTQRAQATRWLLEQEGVAIPNVAPPERTVGHDTAIVGWPWVAETHSWLEPTAVAILALRREGRRDHPRVREGLRLIRDRAIPTGGWNYGNKIAFGHDLRPQPAPTGLALLALAGIDGQTKIVERAVAYLQEALPSTRAPQSLCWGVLGLRAWECCPESAGGWLDQAFEQTLCRHDAAPQTAHLMLAAGERSLEVLGLAPERESRHEG
jgi:hypothetical protein